jgi:hypothetical protein
MGMKYIYALPVVVPILLRNFRNLMQQETGLHFCHVVKEQILYEKYGLPAHWTLEFRDGVIKQNVDRRLADSESTIPTCKG